MKTLYLLISLLVIFAAACDDDSDSGCTAESCNTWESCTDSGACLPLEGRCNSADDCDVALESCNLDTHTCETIPECTDSSECTNPDLPVCDETGTCVAEAVTCNDTKTPSGVTLPADECGAHTACIDSSDCAATERCENLPVDGTDYTRACCVEGPRGCLDAGTECSDEFDCESGLCLNHNDGTYYCSMQCDQTTTCPDPITECYDMVIMMACVVPQ